MTGPVGSEVGTAYVSVIPSASGFAKKLRGDLERELRSADLDKVVERAFGNRTIKLPALEALSTQPLTAPVDLTVDSGGLRRRLQVAVDRAAAGVDAEVDIDVDVDRSGGIGSLPQEISGITSALQGAAGSSAQFGGSLAGAASTASGPVGALIGTATALGAALVGIGAAATIGVPALSALAGAAASIPAALSGAAAALGALKLGFSGIADAFKPAKGGGGGGGGEDPAARARRIAAAERGVEAARRGIAAATRGLQAAERVVADAERGVAEALRRSMAAQQAVNRARIEAREDLEDLNRSLRGAQLDEESAALAVLEAQRELNAARESGNIPDIQRADLAYRQAQLTLENARDSTEDLGLEQADAAKKGVDGSEKVQAALREQTDAQQGVRDAQQGVIDAQNALLSANDGLKASYDGLASAQDALATAQTKMASGASGVGQQLVKLAPNAQKFVDAVKALKPAFERLRLDVQQRLFAGLDKTVTHLGDAWLPALTTTLGKYADTFNGFFRNLGTGLSEPEFIRKIQDGAEGARKGMAAIGDSITQSLVPAFGALSRAAGPFLDKLGQEIADIVTEFSNWVLEGERTGALKDFFTTAAASMHDLFRTGKLVGKIVGDLFRILTGSNLAKGSRTPLDSLNDGLEKVHAYLSDPENQTKIKDFFNDAKGAIEDFGRSVSKIQGWIEEFDKLKNSLFPDSDKDRATTFGEDIGKNLVIGVIAGVGAAIEANFTSFGPLLWEGDNSLIGRIKRGLGINSPSTLTMAMGRELVNGLIKGVDERIGALQAKVRELPGRIRIAFGNAAGHLYDRGRQVAAGLGNGIASLYTWLSTRAGNLRVTVLNALSGAGNWLYNTGKNIVYGLYSGVVSLYGWLRSRVREFINATVPGPIQDALGIRSPSKVTAELGRYVAEGLAVGITSGSSMVEKAATGMAAAAVPSIAPGLVSNPGRGSGGGYAAGELRIVIDGNGDWLMEGLRRNIKVRYNGDPTAAFGS